MKIIFFLGHLGTGGAEQQLTNLSMGMSRKHDDVHVVTLFPGGKYAKMLECCESVKVESLWLASSRFSVVNVLKILIAPLRLRRIINREHPNFVYSMLYLTNLIAWFACMGDARGRLMWGIRASNMSLNWKRRIPERLCAILSRSVPLIISNSFAGRNHHVAHGYRPARFAVVPNGVDVDRFRFNYAARESLRQQLGLERGNILIGRIGRLDLSKDYETFLRAAAIVSRNLSHALFVCVGGGPALYFDELRALTMSLRISDRVFWLGDVDDTSGIYSGMDLVVSSSVYEGSPNTIAEAMSCGIPCVVTDVGDSSNVVNGLCPVVEAGDPAAIATAIQELLASDSAGVPHSRLRKSIIENYSAEKMVSNTLEQMV